MDGKVVVTVVNTPDQPAGSIEAPNAQKTLEAWTKKGQMFVGGGAGIMYALEDNVGLLVEGKAGQLFPASGNFVALSGGLTYGL